MADPLDVQSLFGAASPMYVNQSMAGVRNPPLDLTNTFHEGPGPVAPLDELNNYSNDLINTILQQLMGAAGPAFSGTIRPQSHDTISQGGTVSPQSGIQPGSNMLPGNLSRGNLSLFAPYSNPAIQSSSGIGRLPPR